MHPKLVTCHHEGRRRTGRGAIHAVLARCGHTLAIHSGSGGDCVRGPPAGPPGAARQYTCFLLKYTCHALTLTGAVRVVDGGIGKGSAVWSGVRLFPRDLADPSQPPTDP